MPSAVQIPLVVLVVESVTLSLWTERTPSGSISSWWHPTYEDGSWIWNAMPVLRPCVTTRIPSEWIILSFPLFHLDFGDVCTVDVVIEVCLSLWDNKVLALAKVDALWQVLPWICLIFSCCSNWDRVIWYGWTWTLFLWLNLDCWQHISVTLIFLRLPLSVLPLPPFRCSVCVSRWHVIVDLVWIMLCCTNPTWSEMSYPLPVVIISIINFRGRCVNLIDADFLLWLQVPSLLLISIAIWAVVFVRKTWLPLFLLVLAINELFEATIASCLTCRNTTQHGWGFWLAQWGRASWLTATPIFWLLILGTSTSKLSLW